MYDAAYFFFLVIRPYDCERPAESVEAFSAVLDTCEVFALFIFIVCVRPLGSLPLCSSLLSPGVEHPEAELAPAAQPRLFLPSAKQMGFLVQLVHPTSPALTGQSSPTGSWSCSFALKPGEFAPLSISIQTHHTPRTTHFPQALSQVK